MTKSRAQRTQEMRQSILDASLELFMEQGYEKTTTRQIIQKVGILNGSLYNIYKSKEDIFSDIAMNAVSECVSAIDEVVGEDRDFSEKFCFPVCVQVYVSSKSPRIGELLSVAHEHSPIQRKIVGFHKDLFIARGIDEALIGNGEFDLRSIACSGAMSLILRRMADEPGNIDVRSAMKLMCQLNLVAFDLNIDDLDGYVNRMIDDLKTHELVICGVRI